MYLKQRACGHFGIGPGFIVATAYCATFPITDHHMSEPFEIDFFGLSYSGNLNNFIDWTVFYYGAYAVDELRLLAALADACALRESRSTSTMWEPILGSARFSCPATRTGSSALSRFPWCVRRWSASSTTPWFATQRSFPSRSAIAMRLAFFTRPQGPIRARERLATVFPTTPPPIRPVQVVRGDDFFPPTACRPLPA